MYTNVYAYVLNKLIIIISRISVEYRCVQEKR